MRPEEVAARAWGLDPGALRPVASAYRPHAAFRAGSVLLKPFRYGERPLYYATRALLHLERQGCPHVPRLVPTPSGKPYLRLGRKYWYATTWLDGRPPRFPAELPAAAEALAAFHRATEGGPIPWSASRSWRRRWQGLVNDLHTFQQWAATGQTAFDRTYAQAAPSFITRAEQALTALQGPDYDEAEAAARASQGFCHRDVTAANLLVTPLGQVRLVDPDTFGADLRLHDLVHLLLTGCQHSAAEALKALNAYGLLTPAERRLLPRAYLLPREFWWAGVCQYRRPMEGLSHADLLQQTITGAPLRDACAKALCEALDY